MDRRERFRRVVWCWLLEEGPSTARELLARHPHADGTLREAESLWPRLAEMHQRGEIRVVGRRGGGRRGPKERVYEAVPRDCEPMTDGELRPSPLVVYGVT